MQGGTVSSALAATTRAAELSVRSRMCLDDMWRCCLGHVADVYVPAAAGAFSSARAATRQPSRLFQRPTRNGAERGRGAGAWRHGARPAWGTPYNSGDDPSLSSVGTQGVQVRRGVRVGQPERADGRADHSPVLPALCLSEEHGHGDSSAGCLHGCYEGVRRAACGADIIDDDHLPAPEEGGIDLHVVLDVRGQLQFAGDVDAGAPSADQHMWEAVDCPSDAAQ